MKNINDHILEILHNHSDYHKDLLLKSEKCYCFYCCKSFDPNMIKEWIDGELTALCPICGIDSVIPECTIDILNKYNLTLQDMNRYWFEVITKVDIKKEG